jgi:ankyrin repeat protein
MKLLFFRAVFLAAIVSSFISCAGTLKPSHQNPKDYTALDAAVEGCDLALTKTLIAKDPSSVNAAGWANTTPLYLAALNDCKEVAEFLLEKGALVDLASKAGATPLHIAASRNHLELVKLLGSHKANVNAEDSQGCTAMDRALHLRHSEVAEYLRQHGGRTGKCKNK